MTLRHFLTAALFACALAADAGTAAAADADCAKAANPGDCYSALVADVVAAMNKKLEAVAASMKGDDTLAEEFNSSQASWENYRDKACEFVWNMRDTDPRQLADSEACELALTRERIRLLDTIFPPK